jgi:hypothetical protein
MSNSKHARHNLNENQELTKKNIYKTLKKKITPFKRLKRLRKYIFQRKINQTK